jgi:hypothetical protein
MRKLRALLPLPLLTLLPLAIAATCVTTVVQKGDSGPWVGEITNAGDQTINSALVPVHIRDSRHAPVAQTSTYACPWTVLPGQRAAFEVTLEQALAAATPPATPLSAPLHASFEPATEQQGFGANTGDGLFAQIESTLDQGRVINVRVTNNGTGSYVVTSLCGVALTESGAVDGVAFAEATYSLRPGDSTVLSLIFPTGVHGTLRLYPGGALSSDRPPCCPRYGPSTWHSVDTGPFSVLLPPGWIYEPDQGIDSFIGSFVGDGVRLHFDYGWYSNSLPYDNDPAYHVHFETVAGRDAKVAYPNSGDGETGIYFPQVTGSGSPFVDSVVTKHNLIGQDLTPAQRDIALQIYRTIRFDAP